jgi:hypothetical protein
LTTRIGNADGQPSRRSRPPSPGRTRASRALGQVYDRYVRLTPDETARMDAELAVSAGRARVWAQAATLITRDNLDH